MFVCGGSAPRVRVWCREDRPGRQSGLPSPPPIREKSLPELKRLGSSSAFLCHFYSTLAFGCFRTSYAHITLPAEQCRPTSARWVSGCGLFTKGERKELQRECLCKTEELQKQLEGFCFRKNPTHKRTHPFAYQDNRLSLYVKDHSQSMWIGSTRKLVVDYGMYATTRLHRRVTKHYATFRVWNNAGLENVLHSFCLTFLLLYFEFSTSKTDWRCTRYVLDVHLFDLFLFYVSCW